MAKKKKKSFERPKDWEKKTKRSYFDKDSDYTGEKYEDYNKEEKEKKKKFRKTRFGKLIEKLTGK